MTIRRLILPCAVMFVASISTGYAGPCTTDIDAMQGRIDRMLEAKAEAGPSARESAGADLSHQPTPGSEAAVEEKLGELSPQTVETVKSAMARARAADGVNDKTACEQALAEARRAMER